MALESRPMFEKYLELLQNPLFYVLETLVLVFLLNWWIRRRNKPQEDEYRAGLTEEELPLETAVEDENPDDGDGKPSE